MFFVRKKNGTIEKFEKEKIFSAISKSANRIGVNLTQDEKEDVVIHVFSSIEKCGKVDTISVEDLHKHVEGALLAVDPDVAKSYMNYRNYKKEFGYAMMDDIESQVKRTLEEVDRENSNSNTRYISTKRTEIAQIFAKEMYQKMFLDIDVVQAIKDGYIYIHDLKDMLLPQFNCCLSDVKTILKGGFELEGVHYNEPKDIRTAVGQVGDIIMVISAQHFGGNTTPQIDKILGPYYKMTIEKYTNRNLSRKMSYEDSVFYAKQDAYNDLKQSLQGLEVMLNTVVSARGTYPFTTFTFGDVANEFEADVCKAILEVRMEGHGLKGKRKTMIFPKLVFLRNKDIHGKGKNYRWLFDLSVKCSSKCMYPDYIGEGHKREGKYVSPMGELLPN